MNDAWSLGAGGVVIESEIKKMRLGLAEERLRQPLHI